MKLSINFLEMQLNQMGSRCEPVTHRDDRNGFMPKGNFLHQAGLGGPEFNHANGFVEFKIVERDDAGIAIRSFTYDIDQLNEGIEALESKLGTDEEGYATKWNWLQFSRAVMVLEGDPKQAHTVTLRDRAANAPMILGSLDRDVMGNNRDHS